MDASEETKDDQQRRGQRLARRQRRAAAWRAKGGTPSGKTRENQKQLRRAGNAALAFYNETLRDDPERRRKCRKRIAFEEAIQEWKEKERAEGRPVVGLSASTAINKLKATELIHSWSGTSRKKQISWTADVSEDSNPKNITLSFYNEKLRDDSVLRSSCRERSVLCETFNQWKQEQYSSGSPVQISHVPPSNVINHLKGADLIHHTNSTTITWAADVDEMVLCFYNTKLRGNPRLRRSCTNRRVLKDTIDKWKVEQHLDGRTIKNLGPSTIIATLIKLGLIENSNVKFTEDNVWAEGIEGIIALTPQERDMVKSFDRRQMCANRAGLSFYNEKLRDDRVLRRACAYKNILRVAIDEWKGGKLNEGDPPRDAPPSAIIYGLIHKWELIDHVNGGIVAWKEDVRCYDDGVITWKDKWPHDKDGEREWLDEHELRKRGERARWDQTSIVALSFYNSQVRGNPTLRRACADRRFLNDTIDRWKMEPVDDGDPPRNAASSSIILSLHKQWGFVDSFTAEVVVWKEDAVCNKDGVEALSFDDMLVASLNLNNDE